MARWISAAATDESTPPDKPEDDLFAPDLGADAADRLVDVVGHVPVAAAAADVVHEALEDGAALERVRDFGMELHAVEVARLVGHRRQSGSVALLAMTLKPGGSCGDLVAVAHPHVEQAVAFAVAAVLNAFEQLGMAARAHFGIAELAHLCRSRPCPPSCAAMVCMP